MSESQAQPTSRTLGERLFGPRTVGAMFIIPGVLHLARPDIYEPVMPPQLPAPRELILISGVAEIIGGALYVPRATRPFASWWLVLLLIAVYPSNLYMTTKPEIQAKVPGGVYTLIARLPLQFVAIWWVRRLSKRTVGR